MNKTLEERFWFKVNKTDYCWEWVGGKNSSGYGTIYNEKTVLVHRLSWQIHFGDIIEGLCVCHSCDNKKCVNPDHLFLGTQQDNMNDMVEKGGNNSPKGEKNGMHKLSESDIHIIKYMLGEGSTQSNVAKLFGVSQPVISNINLQKAWRDI